MNMKATELLVSPSVGRTFAAMDDGTYRWVSDDMRLQAGGPNAGWVKRGRTTACAALNGEPNVQRLRLGHENLLQTLNAHIGEAAREN